MRKSVLILLSGITMAASSMAQTTEGDPKLTEVWTPVPAIVTPGSANTAPSDAIVLFNGKDGSQWQNKKDASPIKWKIEGDALTVEKGTGDIQSKKSFGSCQLHIEWRTPSVVVGESQGRGNSGIFFMGQYELQVLDSYDNKTYSNGQAGSIYKQFMPLVNASKKPGEWQTYDVIFTAPKFKADGSLESPAKFTVLHNGVLIQNGTEAKGGTVYIGQPKYTAHDAKGPFVLQDHGNPVSFRNIWVREL
ncbi:MAG: DUF1080 domain-containing protein [Gemmatimonadaceae bacterium]|nr:DUF1080 domain-containing protein [Chitinophagaceae bacterium]